jgi:hypothetical protein
MRIIVDVKIKFMRWRESIKSLRINNLLVNKAALTAPVNHRIQWWITRDYHLLSFDFVGKLIVSATDTRSYGFWWCHALSLSFRSVLSIVVGEGSRIILPNVPGQVSPLAFGMISCASRRHDKSAEGMGINCTGPLGIFLNLSHHEDAVGI